LKTATNDLFQTGMALKAQPTSKTRAIDRIRDAEEMVLPQTTELLADLKRQVAGHIELALEGTAHFVVGIQWSPDFRRLSVKVDGDQGVNIDACATLNRSLGKLIDEHGWEGPIVLEVGSPGAEAPLVLSRQYPQHLGRQLKITQLNGAVLMGILMDADASKLVLKGKDGLESTIAFPEIKEAKVVLF